MKRLRGFTLVEIMIVAAIIALLAAISIPSILRSRITANEGAAIGNMQGLSTAVQTFWSANATLATPLPAAGAAGWTALQPAVNPYINFGTPAGATITKSGYVYQMYGGAAGSTGADFYMVGRTQTPATTGNWDYCFTADGIVRRVAAAAGSFAAFGDCTGAAAVQ